MIASFREREIVWGLKIPIVDALASYHKATGPWQRTTIASYSLNIEASFCVEVSHQAAQAHCPVKQIATLTTHHHSGTTHTSGLCKPWPG